MKVKTANFIPDEKDAEEYMKQQEQQEPTPQLLTEEETLRVINAWTGGNHKSMDEYMADGEPTPKEEQQPTDIGMAENYYESKGIRSWDNISHRDEYIEELAEYGKYIREQHKAKEEQQPIDRDSKEWKEFFLQTYTGQSKEELEDKFRKSRKIYSEADLNKLREQHKAKVDSKTKAPMLAKVAEEIEWRYNDSKQSLGRRQLIEILERLCKQNADFIMEDFEAKVDALIQKWEKENEVNKRYMDMEVVGTPEHKAYLSEYDAYFGCISDLKALKEELK